MVNPLTCEDFLAAFAYFNQSGKGPIALTPADTLKTLSDRLNDGCG
jgi:hypothetical protein